MEEGLEVRPPGALGASPLHITIEADDETGVTDVGTPFHAIRYRATLRVHSASASLTSTPSVGADPGPARTAARDDLLSRIALTVTPGL